MKAARSSPPLAAGEAALIAVIAVLASLLLCAHCTHPKRRGKGRRKEPAGARHAPQRSRLRKPKAKSRSEKHSRTHSHSTTGSAGGGRGTAHSVDKRAAIAQMRRSRMRAGQYWQGSVDTGFNETQSAGRHTAATGADPNDESYEQLQSNLAASRAAAAWAEMVPFAPVPDCQPRTQRTPQRHRRGRAHANAAPRAEAGEGPAKPAKPMPPLGVCDESRRLGDGRPFLQGGRPLAKAEVVPMPGDSRRGNNNKEREPSPRCQVLATVENAISPSHRDKANAKPAQPLPPAQGGREVPKPQAEQRAQGGGGGAQAQANVTFWKKTQPQAKRKE